MTFRQFAFNNVARNKRVYLGHFLSSTFAVIIFFTFGLIAYHPALKGNITELSQTMNSFGKGSFQVSQYIIYIFSIFFILYSVSSFLKKRKREFGIMMILGLSPRQFNKLVFYENIIIGTMATIIGIGMGLVFSKLILLVSASILTVEKGLPFYFPSKAIAITGIGFTVLFLIISFFTSKMIRVTKLVELIKSEEKPKSTPKASIFLSALAMLLIGAGYAVVFYFTMFAKEMSTQAVFTYIGMTVLLVCAGTYFFFTQLSVYTLKAVKGNERLFFKKTNILSVSELVYRIKDNAVTFFLVSVLSAVAFTAIGTSSAVGDVLINQLDTPYAIEYESYLGNTHEQGHIAVIENELKKQELPYTLVSYVGLTGNVQTIKASDYNKYAKQLGYKTVDIENPSETVAIKGSTAENNPNKGSKLTLHEGMEKVRIKQIVTNKYFGDFFPIYILADENFTALAEQIKKDGNGSLRIKNYYDFLVKDWKDTWSVAKKVAPEMKNRTGQQDYYVTFLSLQWNMIQQLNGIFSILTVLVGIVFFVFASSFLYFRLFTDLEKDQEKYRMLTKIGLGRKELSKVVTREMSVLFFLPFVIAMIHSSVAYLALQVLVERTAGSVTLADNFAVVLGSFFLFHLIYFFIMRKSYLTQLNKEIY
ncbi:ABC transporter permease [Bacillus sp. DNRA2]|uniref:ABC transporter permease n=1 Tax=Bacillus sp. DNRA2 TaxID=2723053 RepID=UPI00145FBC42|nr:ABC transporter permease [Bacillus sp. DNRA2]NMD71633.1 ABC transporter permease [Bacillus sp. DNRA2]